MSTARLSVYVYVCNQPSLYCLAYTARVMCYLFISIMVFGDARDKMSKNMSPRFFVSLNIYQRLCFRERLVENNILKL